MLTQPLSPKSSETGGQWPLGIGCCEPLNYRDADGYCQCFPYFIPMGVCSPCCLIGRIQSALDDEEEPCLCEMGPRGWCYCCITAPVSVWGPLGGAVFFSCIAPCYREKVRRKYNLNQNSDGDECCCGNGTLLNSCCQNIWIGCSYPCVFFQLFMTVREMRNRAQIPVATAMFPSK